MEEVVTTQTYYWACLGATKNNHEHHVSIGRVALSIRTPPSTRLGRYHDANLLGEMTFVISWQQTKFKNYRLVTVRGTLPSRLVTTPATHE